MQDLERIDGDATYCAEDNKLRLYPGWDRLSDKVRTCLRESGFKWAAKQELYVAPMWTPEREDLLLALCGEIGDEDTSPEERAEERADRFLGYSGKRRAEAGAAQEAVREIADAIPLGQPILVGHHSERHARRGARRIETGMRRAVKLFKTAEYWKGRAQGSLRDARYKAQPAVRARRIKRLETDQRREERKIQQARDFGEIWNRVKTREHALTVANIDQGAPWSLWSRLTDDEIGVDEARREALESHKRTIAYAERWLEHIKGRLAYEREMLGDFEPPKRAKKKQPPLLNYRSAAIEVENPYRAEHVTLQQVEMTKDEWKRLYRDYKATRLVWGGHHRVRVAYRSGALEVVFLTDSNEHTAPTRPADGEPPPRGKEAVALAVPLVAGWDPREHDPEEETFREMERVLDEGIKTVSVPQLFPTPPELARRAVELANLSEDHRILEPSAGTGALIEAILEDRRVDILDAFEISGDLCKRLAERFGNKVVVETGDFLEQRPEDQPYTYHRVLMNPPFRNGDDIKHILHARKFLTKDGLVVAFCAGGPRQEKALRPLAETWERLPAGAFEGTGVRAVLLTLRAEGE